MIAIIAVIARFMKNAARRKESFMKNNVLRRMEAETKEYREYLVSGKVSAEQLVEEAYQLVVRRFLHYIIVTPGFVSLSNEEWGWLDRQEHIMDYLYSLWLASDSDLTEEFARIIHSELDFDMEVHADEADE